MINIAKILKDCPKGIELYSPIFGKGTLHKVTDRIHVNFQTEHNNKCFDVWGKYSKGGECMLFPSEDDRDWSEFKRPFKDGDILINILGDIYICKTVPTVNFCGSYASINSNGDFISYYTPFLEDSSRYATEEEKQKLFDAIKDNGYKWNAETKTLEKLIEPKFKVGDRVKDKRNKKWFVAQVSDRHFDISNIPGGTGYFVSIEEQDQYELVPNKFDISTLKPFDSRVLVRDYDHTYWRVSFFGFFDKDECIYDTVRGAYKQCIPYRKNEHLLGKTDDCDEFYKNW